MLPLQWTGGHYSKPLKLRLTALVLLLLVL